jgi:hypothetical protein
MLDSLNTHMFTAENYRRNEKQACQTEYSPLESDSLFWCLFIMKYGKKEYEMIPEHLRKNREMDEKNDIIAFLFRQDKENGKGKEKGRKIQEMVSILSSEITTLSLIPSICHYYNIPITIPVIRGAGAHIIKYSVSTETKTKTKTKTKTETETNILYVTKR